MKNHATAQLLQEIEQLRFVIAELQHSEAGRKRAEQIKQTLFHISNAVNTAVNLDQLYRSIHKSLGSILDVSNFFIAIYQKKDDSVVFPYFVDEMDHTTPEIKPVAQSRSLTCEVIRTGKPLLVTKQELLSPRYKEAEYEQLGTPSEIWIGVPLKIRNEVIGVIAAQSYTDPHRYNYQDIDVLMSVSDQVAIAIERQRSVELLKASEQRYRNLVENIDGAIFATDERGIFTYISPAVNRITGYNQTDILGKAPVYLDTHSSELPGPDQWLKHRISGELDARSSYEQIVYPEDRQSVHDTLEEALRQGEPYKMEYRIVRQDGKVQWVCEKGTVVRNAHNGLCLEGVILDVQEQKYAEELNQVLFNISNVMNTTLDLDDLYELIHCSLQRVVDASNFYIALYNRERDLIQFPYNTDDIDDITVISNASQSDSLTSEVIRTGRPLLLNAQEHESLRNQRGMEIVGIPSAVWLGVPLIVENEVIGAMVVQNYSDPDRYDQRDVDILNSVAKHVAIAIERKRAYEDLWKATAAVEAANQELMRVNQQLQQAMDRANEMAMHEKNAARSKSAFLANMSHEIRTPMNAIIGLTALMLETELTDKQRDYLNKIHHSGHTLLDLINDILDFSKIEAEKLILEQIEFHLHDVIDILIDMFASKAAEKGIELIPLIAPEIPFTLIGDPIRLRQILINLTNNALKFTSNGEVVIRVDMQARRKDRVQLAFSVSDTGIGIPGEQISNLFDSFVQADGSTSRQYGGTGLGLAISKRLVEIMQGSLRVDSRPGEGSTFGFTIEFGVPQNTQTQPFPLPINFQGMKALVVDDNARCCELLEKMLLSLSFQVTLARSGRDALDFLQQASDKPAYHLIVLDLIMPDVDGLHTAEHIRKNPIFANIPIILLLTFGREDLIQQAMAVGVNGFLTKPIKQSLLFNTIMELFTHKTPNTPLNQIIQEHHADLIERLKGAQLLLVEDSAANQHVTTEILKKAMICVDTANNGVQALHAIRSRKYDLVLMDIQMPVMNGYQTTQEIRKDPENRNLPIIALTAYAMKGDREKCLEIGMNDYISKPIIIHQLFAVLARWLPSAAPRGDGNSAAQKTTSKATLCVKRTGHNAAMSINFTKVIRKLDDLLEQRDLEAEEYFMLLQQQLRGNISCAHDLQCLERYMSALDFDHARISLRSIADLLCISMKG